MGLIEEFKEFAIKGNAIDLAVGAIIGAAFGKIVASITDDLIMPPVGFIVSKVTGGSLSGLNDKFIPLDMEKYVAGMSLAAAKTAGVPVIAYGAFINVAIQFLILAIAVFMIVKAINNLRRAPDSPAVPPAPTTQEILLAEIRDLLAGGTKLPTGTAAVFDK